MYETQHKTPTLLRALIVTPNWRYINTTAEEQLSILCHSFDVNMDIIVQTIIPSFNQKSVKQLCVISTRSKMTTAGKVK